MNSNKINLIVNAVNALPDMALNESMWTVFRGVEELANNGDESMLKSILEEYADNLDEIDIGSYEDVESRLQNLAEYVAKYPYMDVCEFPRPQLCDMLAEIRELAMTEDEWKAQAILAREINFLV